MNRKIRVYKNGRTALVDETEGIIAARMEGQAKTFSNEFRKTANEIELIMLSVKDAEVRGA